MAAPVITQLPPAPSRADDGNSFANKADAFLGALPLFREEVNAAVQFMNDHIAEVDQDAQTASQAAASASDSAALAVQKAADAGASADAAAQDRQAVQVMRGEAQASANTASAQAVIATQKATEAKEFRDQTKLISGLETVEQAAAYAVALDRMREKLLKEATLSLDFVSNDYRVYEGLSAGMVKKPLVEILSISRASQATGETAIGQIAAAGIDEPRVVWAGGRPQGLLVEEQRTNLVLWSEDYTGSSWTKNRSSVDTSTTVLNPDGAPAQRIVEDTANGSHTIRRLVTLLEGQQYTWSLYARAGENHILHVWGTGGWPYADTSASIDLHTGEVLAGQNVTVEPLMDGWYRVSKSGINATSSATSDILIGMARDPSITTAGGYQGDGVSGLYVFGVQIEQGTYPTSYIPTQDAQVTRVADSVSREVAGDFNPNDFTYYCDITKMDSGAAMLLYSGSGSGERVGVVDVSSAQVVTNGGATVILNQTIPSLINGGRVAIACKAGYYRLAVNGVISGQSDNTSKPPLITTLAYGFKPWLNNRASASIRDSKIFPRALSEAELIALTTPENSQ